ncbi:hypothetical protein [Shewanella sp.]|uniref:hypothetical protein n=1 Tax=Shewanella sp. TaxID=50422 RepID=UPI0040541FE3
MKFSIVLLIGLATPVMAEPPTLFALQSSQVLSDIELDSMKGKFTDNGQDYYFGLQMKTQFIQDNGVQDQVSMQVEFIGINSQASVVISVSEAGQIDNSQSLVLDTLGQSVGLQQRIQIAGETNLAVNDLTMSQGRLDSLTNGVNLSLGTSLISSNGTSVFSANTGSLGYQVNLASGQATQGVNYGQGNGQLLQSIAIEGINHGVINQSTIRYDGMSVGTLSSSLLGRQISDLRTIGF